MAGRPPKTISRYLWRCVCVTEYIVTVVGEGYSFDHKIGETTKHIATNTKAHISIKYGSCKGNDIDMGWVVDLDFWISESDWRD